MTADDGRRTSRFGVPQGTGGGRQVKDRKPNQRSSILDPRSALLSVASQAAKILFRAKGLTQYPPQLERMLVLKPCCLGDVLHASAVLAPLRAAYPHAQIDWAVGAWSRSMLLNNPHLDHVIDCGRVGSGRYGLRDIRQFVQRLRPQRYQACFTLDRSPLLGLVPWLAGIPLRVGYDSDGRGFAHNVRVPVPPSGTRHESELCLDTLRALQIPVLQPRLEFFASQADRTNLSTKLPLNFEAMRAPLLVMHPGGGDNPGMKLPAKRWPPQRFAAVASHWLNGGATVVLLGGPNDRDLVNRVLANMPDPNRFLNRELFDLCGRLSWGESGALLARAHLFLGNDTGMLNLAVAAGTPTVALFGPTDPRMYGPYGLNRDGQPHITLWQDVGCNPCFLNGRWNSACPHFNCIHAITVEQVIAATTRLLKSKA